MSNLECQKIQSEYGFVPQICNAVQAGQVTAPFGILTDEQKESNIFFLTGSKRIDATSGQQLEALAGVLQTAALAHTCVQLIGHSSASGDPRSNKKIGLERARSVSVFLGFLLDSPERIDSVISHGEEDLLTNFSPNNDVQKRVSILLKSCL
ncbi:MAG: OmpA family protein [Paracoccaceae bacterium]